MGWGASGVVRSPLRGPAGNREFFLHLTRGATSTDLATRIESETAPAEGGA
jgi:hypothetical protein